MSASEADVVDEIVSIKKKLDEAESNSEVIMDILIRLAELPIDRSKLSKTKIGVTVGKLRQHPDVSVKSKAKNLVDTWKSALTPTPAKKEPQGGADDSSTKAASDDLKFIGPFCHEDRRNKVRELLFRALVEGMPEDQVQMMDENEASNTAASIEEALWNHHVDDNNNTREYNNQMRSLKSNLSDRKNPDFNARVYLGVVTPESLAVMPSVEMASDAKKKERQKAKKDALEACQSDWDLRNIKRAAGQFPCGKCKSSNTSYFQMQTRSSDEPMTTFVSCVDCGNRWKF